MGSMAIFIFVVWHAAITQPTPDDLPIISAPSGPARVAPALPGGMEVPNQKMTVFETFQEEPVGSSDGSNSSNKNTFVEKSLDELSKSKAKGAVSKKADVTGGGVEPKPSSLDQQGASESNDSVFMAQLGSFGSLEGAEQGWEHLRGWQEDMMEGLMPVISQVDLGEVGTFYRLRTKIMGGRKKVEKFCEIMLKSSIECMVVEP